MELFVISTFWSPLLSKMWVFLAVWNSCVSLPLHNSKQRHTCHCCSYVFPTYIPFVLDPGEKRWIFSLQLVHAFKKSPIQGFCCWSYSLLHVTIEKSVCAICIPCVISPGVGVARLLIEVSCRHELWIRVDFLALCMPNSELNLFFLFWSVSFE